MILYIVWIFSLGKQMSKTAVCVRVFGPNRDKLQLGMASCICDFGTGVNRPEDAFLFDINGKNTTCAGFLLQTNVN